MAIDISHECAFRKSRFSIKDELNDNFLEWSSGKSRFAASPIRSLFTFLLRVMTARDLGGFPFVNGIPSDDEELFRRFYCIPRSVVHRVLDITGENKRIASKFLNKMVSNKLDVDYKNSNSLEAHHPLIGSEPIFEHSDNKEKVFTFDAEEISSMQHVSASQYESNKSHFGNGNFLFHCSPLNHVINDVSGYSLNITHNQRVLQPNATSRHPFPPFNNLNSSFSNNFFHYPTSASGFSKTSVYHPQLYRPPLMSVPEGGEMGLLCAGYSGFVPPLTVQKITGFPEMSGLLSQNNLKALNCGDIDTKMKEHVWNQRQQLAMFSIQINETMKCKELLKADIDGVLTDIQFNIRLAKKFELPDESEMRELRIANEKLKIELHLLLAEMENIEEKDLMPCGEEDGSLPEAQQEENQAGVKEARRGSDSEEEEEGWNCSACTFINHPGLNGCEVCEMPRVKQ